MLSRLRSSSDISERMIDLIVGATGVLGSEIAGQLAQRGRRVRALVRSSSRPERVTQLQAAGVELVHGDLKQPQTLEAACAGVTRVISTASATNSREPGDSIETVDGSGQLALVEAARKAAIEQFVFVSFPESRLDFPLQSAKRAVESSLRQSGLGYTVLQPAPFFEIWFSEVLGFDWRRRSARVFGGGQTKISFVSYHDVVRVAVGVLGNPAALGRTLPFGGPAQVSQRDVIGIFEELTNAQFNVENVDAGLLATQLEQPGDSLARSFAALMLLGGVRDEYALASDALAGVMEIELTSARTFVERIVGAA